ncbi:unnamed protein product, partial [Amoebophrya sp. A120]
SHFTAAKAQLGCISSALLSLSICSVVCNDLVVVCCEVTELQRFEKK